MQQERPAHILSFSYFCGDLNAVKFYLQLDFHVCEFYGVVDTG